MVEKGKIIICLLGLGFSNASFAQSPDGRKQHPPHLCSANPPGIPGRSFATSVQRIAAHHGGCRRGEFA